MEAFKICVCNTCDLPDSYIEAKDIKVVSLAYQFNGNTYERGKQELTETVFYGKMRGGQLPTTLSITYEHAKAFFCEILQETTEILQISFSSGLSNSFQNLKKAASDIMTEKPDVNILVIDSLCASLGEGLLIQCAVELKENGSTLQEVASWVEANKLHLVHAFTVEDILYLYRGGRLSWPAAMAGSVSNAKPILHMDNTGQLTMIGKVHSRKKALDELVEYMEEHTGTYKKRNDRVFISHGDALEDAEYVADQIQKRIGISRILINFVCPIIGTYSGPGTVAIFFFGDKR